MFFKWLMSLSLISLSLMAMEDRIIEEKESSPNIFNYMLQETNPYSWPSELVNDYLLPSKQVFDNKNTAITSVGYSPDSKLAVGSNDGKLHIFDTYDLSKPLSSYEFHNAIDEANWSPSGQHLHVADFDNYIKFYDLTKQKIEQLTTIPLGMRPMTSAFCPDGKSIAIGMGNGTVSIRSVPDLTQQKSFTHNTWVSAVAFSADGENLVTAADDYIVRVRRFSDLQEIAKIPQGSWTRVAKFSPDGRYLALVGDRGPISIVDTADWQKKKSISINTKNFCTLAFHPSGKFLLASNEDKKISVIETKNWNTIGFVDCDDTIYSLSCSPDGLFFACGGKDNKLTVRSFNFPFMEDKDKIVTFRDYIFAKVAAHESKKRKASNQSNEN